MPRFLQSLFVDFHSDEAVFLCFFSFFLQTQNSFHYKACPCSFRYQVSLLLLYQENINYLIIDEEIEKKEFKNNNYINYNFNMEEIFYNTLRVEKIIDYLNDNIYNISDKLNKIEEILE